MGRKKDRVCPKMCSSSVDSILDPLFGIRKAPATIFARICCRAGGDNVDVTMVSKHVRNISARILIAWISRSAITRSKASSRRQSVQYPLVFWACEHRRSLADQWPGIAPQRMDFRWMTRYSVRYCYCSLSTYRRIEDIWERFGSGEKAESERGDTRTV